MPETLQATLAQFNTIPLDKLQGFLLNDLPNLVTMPQLPEHLHNSEAHRNFFKGFTGLLDEHYFMLRSISVQAIEEDAPLWVQGISKALQAFSLPGTAVAGGALEKAAQLIVQAKTETKARTIIQQFASDLHFTVTARQAGVLLTQHMERVPEIEHSVLQQAKRLLTDPAKKLGKKAKLLADNPYEHLPKVLDAYILFFKSVKKHPEIMSDIHANNPSFQEYCETAALNLVSQGLGLSIQPVQAEGSSHAARSRRGKEVQPVEVLDVHEVPSSEPAENSEVQQLKEQVAKLTEEATESRNLINQLLEAQNTGGMALAQTQQNMLGVGGEVYAPMAENSTATEHRLRSYTLQINELREEVFGNIVPRVQQHDENLDALNAPNAEFNSLKEMVTASAHYLRRFGVINYANSPVTVQLANGQEVDLAQKLERLHHKQPNAATKPYRPKVELQNLIGELADAVSSRADLDLASGKRILAGVVTQRTRVARGHDHNVDVVKMAIYYLRRFGLVHYTQGEATIQLAESEGEVSIGTTLARIHRSQPNAQRKQYRLQHLLEHLVMELPDAVKNQVDLDLPDNAKLLSEIDIRMASKRDLQARSPVSLREVARQAQERQRLLGE